MARLTEVEQDCPLNAGDADTKCDYHERYWKGYATKRMPTCSKRQQLSSKTMRGKQREEQQQRDSKTCVRKINLGTFFATANPCWGVPRREQGISDTDWSYSDVQMDS